MAGIAKTRNEIVTRALRQLGVVEAGEAPEAEDMVSATEALNALIVAWRADGIHLWTRKEATVFLAPGQRVYDLGTGTSDHAAATNAVIQTELASGAAETDTEITVASADDMSEGDHIGIVLDADAFHWTTIASIAGSDVTLDDAMPGDADGENRIYAYPSVLSRPMRVIDTRRRNEDADTDVPISTVAHDTYFALPNKTVEGEINQVFYNPEIPRGQLYVWPVPDTVTRTLQISCQLPLERIEEADDSPEFPAEWLNALTWGLADELGAEYGTPDRTVARVAQKAAFWYQKMLMWDQEPSSIYFQPNLTHTWGD